MKKTIILTTTILAIALAVAPVAADVVELPGIDMEPSDEDTAYKAEMYDKYADLIETVEAGKYQDAIDMIDQMRPKVQEGQVELTLENWEDYFVIEPEYRCKEDAYGDIEEERIVYWINLKPEYQGKQIEISGTLGCIFNYGFYHIETINREDGTFETSAKDDTAEIPGLDPSYKEEQSQSFELSEHVQLAISVCGAAYKDNVDSGRFGGIIVKDADNYIQIVAIPEDFHVVRIEGTIKIGE